MGYFRLFELDISVATHQERIHLWGVLFEGIKVRHFCLPNLSCEAHRHAEVLVSLLPRLDCTLVYLELRTNSGPESGVLGIFSNFNDSLAVLWAIFRRTTKSLALKSVNDMLGSWLMGFLFFRFLGSLFGSLFGTLFGHNDVFDVLIKDNIR